MTPPRIAGTARTGSANKVATLISEAAVSPVPIRAASMPAPTSIRYCVAAPIGLPPGTILLTEFPTTCEAPIAK